MATRQIWIWSRVGRQEQRRRDPHRHTPNFSATKFTVSKSKCRIFKSRWLSLPKKDAQVNSWTGTTTSPASHPHENKANAWKKQTQSCVFLKEHTHRVSHTRTNNFPSKFRSQLDKWKEKNSFLQQRVDTQSDEGLRKKRIGLAEIKLCGFCCPKLIHKPIADDILHFCNQNFDQCEPNLIDFNAKIDNFNQKRSNR